MPNAIGRPAANEYGPYYSAYVDEVADEDVLRVLADDARAVTALLAAVPESRAGHRYAPGKWTVREVVAHMADTERIFVHRALVGARGDSTPQPGFDENAYAAACAAERRSLAEVAAELAAVRSSTQALFGGLAPEAWSRRVVANGVEFTVRALAYIVAGHERHHRRVLQERYLEGGAA